MSGLSFKASVQISLDTCLSPSADSQLEEMLPRLGAFLWLTAGILWDVPSRPVFNLFICSFLIVHVAGAGARAGVTRLEKTNGLGK